LYLPALVVLAAMATLSGVVLAGSVSSGSLDRSFGKDGVATVQLPGETSLAFGLARTPDRKIVQSVMDFDSDSGAVIQYTNRGRRDRTFGESGIASLRFADGVVAPRDLLVGGDGNIFIVGEAQSETADHQYGTGLASLRPNGHPNRAFAEDGLAFPEALENVAPMQMAFAPGRKIVLVGFLGGIPSANTVVARFLPSGRLDPTFSGDGVMRFRVVKNQLTRTVAVDRRGRIVVGSPGGAPYHHVHDIVRLRPNGRFDTSFGNGGRREINSVKGTYEQIKDLAIDRHGRILVAGGEGAIIRLRPDGSLDRHFAKRGVALTSWFIPVSLALNRRGSIFVIGHSGSGYSAESGQVVRLGRKGKQDFSYTYVPGTDYLFDGFIDRKGRLVAGGNKNDSTPAVVRLLGHR
jgi:uncharacterized delta-60 repeat protein